VEGAVTSQFENHIRAICDLPLGSAALRAPSVMLNLIGEIPPRKRLLSITDAHLHDYAKPPRPGRKVGHLTCLGATLQEASDRADVAEMAMNKANPTSTE
jgi:5-(carboxyamino)imidazole ribonucleotide synthase